MNTRETDCTIGQIEFDNQTFYYAVTKALPDARNFSAMQIDGNSILTIPDPTQLVDETGDRLSLQRPSQKGLFYWKRTDGRFVVMPYIFARVYEGKHVVPILKWVVGNDKHRISGWQVWLISFTDKKVLKKIEHPFVTLAPNQRVVFRPVTGYFEIGTLSGEGTIYTGSRLGSQLAAPALVRSTALPLDKEQPQGQPVGLVYGIALYGFSPGDVQYITDTLDWLNRAAPNWFNYIGSQKPFWIQYDARTEHVPWGQAICCDSKGRGRIRVYASSLANKSGEGNAWGLAGYQTARIFFAGLLIHEATHISQWRKGEGKGYTYSKDNPICISIEKGAEEMQVAFLNDARSFMVGERKIQQDYEAIMRQINWANPTEAAVANCLSASQGWQ